VTTTATHYEPSGKAGAAATMGMAAAGLAAAAAGAWLYQFLVDKIPFIYVTFLVSAGFGALIGFAVGVAGKATKCRKPQLVVTMAILGAVVGDLASFRYAYDRFIGEAVEEMRGVDAVSLAQELKTSGELTALQRDLLLAAARADGNASVAKNEFGFGKYIDFRVEEGWEIGRSSSGIPLKGFFVWIIWLLELAIIAAVGYGIAGSVAHIPFDEASMTWMPAAANQTVRINAEPFLASVQAGDVAGMLAPELHQSSPVSAKYTMFTSRPADHAYVSIELVVQDGKEEKTDEVVRYLRIAPDDWTGFLRHGRDGGAPEAGAAKN